MNNLTFKQNVKTILQTNFAGFKSEIIERAVDSICKLKIDPQNGGIIESIADEIGRLNNTECIICSSADYREGYHDGLVLASDIVYNFLIAK